MPLPSVLASFPLCHMTEEDLIQNPQFCKLLATLAQHVDQTGLTAPLKTELDKVSVVKFLFVFINTEVNQFRVKIIIIQTGSWNSFSCIYFFFVLYFSEMRSHNLSHLYRYEILVQSL